MKKLGRLVIGGIQQKIFNLMLTTMLIVALFFSITTYYQQKKLEKIVKDTNVKQEESITSITNATMDAVVDSSMTRQTKMEVMIADNAFSNLGILVSMLGENVRSVFRSPGDYGARPVARPLASRDGTAYLQLLNEEGVDVTDPKLVEKINLAGNLADTMVSMYDTADINAIFIGFPEGFFLICDSRAASKFDEDGSLRPMPVTKRSWYVEAIEEGGLYYSGVETDFVTGKPGIVCAMPVYLNDKLLCVVGADYFLDTMDAALESSNAENAGFTCVLNKEGQVIYAPDDQDVFQVVAGADSPSILDSDDRDLAEFTADALTDATDVRLVNVDGKNYYMAGAPMSSVGWCIVNVIEQQLVDQPAEMLKSEYRRITDESEEDFFKDQKSLRRILIIVFILLLFILATGSILLSKRIIRPLGLITHRISTLGEENIQFRMEDDLRTGDEIEVLAESFAELSAKTVNYMGQVEKAAREKEKMETELGMATAIQASQVPHLFPAFPERKEFDIYASMTPAREVGGDFYDFFLLDSDHLALVMADVSGKGVPAALFMMISKILIRNRVQNGEAPGIALSNVNRQLLEGNEANMFVTLWMGVVELSTGKGVAVNAGHEHPVIRRAGGKYELVVYRHSPALAVMDDMVYKEHEFILEPGDSLFVYTDGVAEAADKENQLFGTDRMLEALNLNPDAPPQEVLQNVMNGIETFTAGAEQFDDITMLSFYYAGPTPEKG